MKILVLMPLDEKSVYDATGLCKALPNELRDKTFCMPMFMEYLINTKQTQNYEWAMVDTILSAKMVYKSAAPDEDLLVIGNMPSEFNFDVVFNFQDPEVEMPYKDEFVANFVEIVNKHEALTDEDRKNLLSVVGDLHKAEESKLALINYAATADFLNAYIKTDPKLDEIKKQYEKRLKELQNKKKGKL